MRATLQHLADLKASGEKSIFPETIKITVGAASCGIAAGAQSIFEVFDAGVRESTLKAVVAKTGCLGMCSQEPLVDITMPGKGRFVYGRVTPTDVSGMLADLKKDAVPRGALFRYSRIDTLLDGSEKRYPSARGKDARHSPPVITSVPFYKKQYRLVLRNCGLIDPENIAEYIAMGGYSALAAVLAKKSPQQVITTVGRARLRGRGGSGFPTGKKWQICRDSGTGQKYIVCNGDEGDPGAYMDRCILESDPHAVLEGMLIAAYAIGASHGFVYIRDEYPLAVTRMEHAIAQAAQARLVGDHILGTPFSCTITVVRGAGAFVCGEETALLKSIQGECGEPNQRPPYPAVTGLWGCPTVINNVETLATVPVIMAKGAHWFSSIGTAASAGTKIFSLVGKAASIGLIEVPMGTSLRTIVHTIGGGPVDGRTCKAVQTGGPSGGCIPEHLFHLPVDYDALAAAGSIMGSGGLIVMDDKTCMVDVARYFMTFLEHESCGKCTPCRVGVRRMRELLDAICAGTASPEDLDLLENLSHMVGAGSLCGLGRTAPNPILTGLRYFRNEFIAHIRDKKCPAGVCKNLITYRVDAAVCTGCGACKNACPAGAATGARKKPHRIDIARCVKCGACEEICPAGAITSG